MVRCAAHVIVCDALLNGLVQFGEVGVELCHIVLKERLLHRYESILAFYNVAGITQRIVSVIHVQFETVQVVCFKTPLLLCRSTESQKAQCDN